MSETKVSGADVRIGAKLDSQGTDADSVHKQHGSAVELCHYRVVSIDEEHREAARADDTWYKYVVDNGKSTIVGHRPGSREQVEEHAEQFVTELNARSGRGGKSVFWSSWHRKSAQKTTDAGD